jgi:hypothetical protein
MQSDGVQQLLPAWRQVMQGCAQDLQAAGFCEHARCLSGSLRIALKL